MVNFVSYVPTGVLGQFIDSIVYLEGLGTGIALQRAYQVIIINVGDNFLTSDPYKAETPTEHFQTVWVNGKHETPFALHNYGTPRMFVINPKPGMLSFFIRVPVSDTNDDALSAEHWGSADIYELRKQLLEEPDVNKGLRMIDEYFTATVQGKDATVLPTLDFITRSMSVKPVQQICDELGFTRKRMLAFAQQYFGGSIKSIQGILRYDEHLGAMAKDPSRSLSSIHAFYDQAHFINDFRARTGMTPSRYQHICRACPSITYTPNFIPLPKETFLQLLGRVET